MLAAVMPLPRLLATPPVTKTYFDMGQGSSGVFLMLQKSGPGRECVPIGYGAGSRIAATVVRRCTVHRALDCHRYRIRTPPGGL